MGGRAAIGWPRGQSCASALLMGGLLWVAFATGAPAAQADRFFVSPSGNDANPGNREQPVASLERARDAIRAAPSDRPRRVVLRGGDYRITETLLLDAKDSGTEAAPVVWEAAPGECVRFLGGVRLTEWRPVADEDVRARLSPEARKCVVKCNLRQAGVASLGEVDPQSAGRAELFYDHRYMTLARYPNEGWLRIADVPPDERFKVKDKDNPSLVRHLGPFQYEGDRPKQWRIPSELWVHGYWTYDWSDEYEPVERLDLENRLVWPKPPYHGYGYTKGQRYCFLNALEELDRAGEWYLDRRTGVVYFWPPGSLDTAEVLFPDLEGPMVLLDHAEHVSVRGIVFECSRGEAVVIKGGSGIEVCGCVVRNIGRTAIDVQGGTGHTVRSCDVYEVASTGIAIEGGDRATLAPGGHAVQNCDVHHYARVQKTYRPAVALHGVGNRMAHCFIHDAPHQGVAYSGNDHVIEYCEFTRIAQETGDVGAIYSAMDWSYMGHVFRHNYFHDIHGPGELGCFTVYPDLPCGGIHLYGNVFYDVDQGFLTNSGRGMTIENNLFLRCARTFRFNVWGEMPLFRPGGAWQMVERLQRIRYDQTPYRTRYPALARLADDFAKGEQEILQRTLPKDNIIRCNVSTGPHFLGLGAQAGLSDVKVEKNLICNSIVFAGSATGDGHAITYPHDAPSIEALLGKTGNVIRFADPGLVDPDGGDFRLRRDSPARKLGFRPIPFEEIGLYTDRYRRRLPFRAPSFAPVSRSFVGETEVRLVACRRRTPSVVRYTLDGMDPTRTSARYRGPIRLTATTTVRAAAFGRGARAAETSPIISATFTSEELGAGHGVYLSDLDELEYIGTDGLGSMGLLKDRAPHDLPLRLAGTEYRKGLMMEPVETPDGISGRITYALEGGLAAARRFRAYAGIEGLGPAAQDSCVLLVEVRRGGTWQREFESGPVRCLQAPLAVEVDVAGASQLRLGVQGAGTASLGVRAVWADARLE